MIKKSNKMGAWLWKEHRKVVVRNVDFNERNLEDSSKDSEPYVLALLICGASAKRSRKLLAVLAFVVRLFFGLCFFLTFSNTASCLMNHFKSFYIFTLATKITAVICWWSVCSRGENFSELLEMMRNLQKKNKKKSTKAVKLLGRTAVALFLAIVFVPSVRSAMLNTSRVARKPDCHTFWMPLVGLQKGFYYFFITVARMFTNWAIPYSVTLFYCLYCFELTNKIKSFCGRLKDRSRSFGVVEYYHAVASAILKLEDSLSWPMLFVLFTNFAEMFRIFTHFIFLAPEQRTFGQLSHSVVNFVQTSLLFLVLVFAADSLQIQFDVFRKGILRTPHLFAEENEQIRFRKKLMLVEDRNFVKLTAWGVFDIKRTIILSAIASLITYGVLLQQFKQ